MTEPAPVIASLAARREQAEAQNAAPATLGAVAAAEQLTALLDLASAGPSVRGARVVGRGSRASVDLRLSDGTTVEFEKVADLGNAGRLALEIAACTGVTPKLKAPQALRAVALVRALAEHEEVYTADQITAEWGTSFLQAADTLTVDMADQVQRWAAFARLRDLDPEQAQRTSGTSIAGASVVLEHHDGTQFVRCGWMRSHVRQEDGSVSQIEIAHRLQRVGWTRRGSTGRIKASRPGSTDALGWTFYEVPAGWEQAR